MSGYIAIAGIVVALGIATAAAKELKKPEPLPIGTNMTVVQGPSNATVAPASYSMSADTFKGDATLTIYKTSSCRMVIISEDQTKMVVGCRRDLFK